VSLGSNASSRSRSSRRSSIPLALTPGTSQRKINATPHGACASRIVYNKYLVGFTTVLTLWALIGDDLKMLLTEKSADGLFDAGVYFCISVFTLEVILSCLGKGGYFLSFYFALDIISTASLVLDLSKVDDMFYQEMRGGKTARIGAKATRLIRVVRLVRILKLYKAYYEASRAHRAAKTYAPVVTPGKDRDEDSGSDDGDEDDWDMDEDDEDDEDNANSTANSRALKESRVGKKLSEFTVRRVICLILTLLLGLPLLQAEPANLTPWSSYYGVDQVWTQFTQWTDQGTSLQKSQYEDSILQFVYYHNWFSRHDRNCGKGAVDSSKAYLTHVFWIGFSGKEPYVTAAAGNATISSAAVEKFAKDVSEQDYLYQRCAIPSQAQNILTKPWNQRCNDDNGNVMLGISLISEDIPNYVSYPIQCPKQMRLQSRTVVKPQFVNETEDNTLMLSLWFDVRPYQREEAARGLIRTALILVLLVLGSMMFSHDAQRLVVDPVEVMISKVDSIKNNPLHAMQLADAEIRAEEKEKQKQQNKRKHSFRMFFRDLSSCSCLTKDDSEPMETVILEKTIIKLGFLLALGFGQAGANIIEKNMTADSVGVNAMIQGRKINAVIGVARVCNFSAAVEILQSKIMQFVNQIAEIVHGVVNEFHGAPNRNNGDTFLVIWHHSTSVHRTAQHHAEMSVVAFSKILGALHSSPKLAEYRLHPGLQFKLTSKECRVKMGFGLHAGWAIEGAVGSEFKIDPSYLSPNVSLTYSIERATQLYNVSLIVSESVFHLCGRRVFELGRLIDRVQITASSPAMLLYCVDLDWRSVAVDEVKPMKIAWNKTSRFKVRQFLAQEKKAHHDSFLEHHPHHGPHQHHAHHEHHELHDLPGPQQSNSGYDPHDHHGMAALFESDPGICQMRQRYLPEFFHKFMMGFQNYRAGEWQVARRLLEFTKMHLGDLEDGPSVSLLEFMASYNFEAPKDWLGHRPLPSSTSIIV